MVRPGAGATAQPRPGDLRHAGVGELSAAPPVVAAGAAGDRRAGAARHAGGRHFPDRARAGRGRITTGAIVALPVSVGDAVAYLGPGADHVAATAVAVTDPVADAAVADPHHVVAGTATVVAGTAVAESARGAFADRPR